MTTRSARSGVPERRGFRGSRSDRRSAPWPRWWSWWCCSRGRARCPRWPCSSARRPTRGSAAPCPTRPKRPRGSGSRLPAQERWRLRPRDRPRPRRPTHARRSGSSPRRPRGQAQSKAADQVALAPTAEGEKKDQAARNEAGEENLSKLESAPMAMKGDQKIAVSPSRDEAARLNQAEPQAALAPPSAAGNRFESALSRYGLPPVWGPRRLGRSRAQGGACVPESLPDGGSHVGARLRARAPLSSRGGATPRRSGPRFRGDRRDRAPLPPRHPSRRRGSRHRRHGRAAPPRIPLRGRHHSLIRAAKSARGR